MTCSLGKACCVWFPGDQSQHTAEKHSHVLHLKAHFAPLNWMQQGFRALFKDRWWTAASAFG